MLARMALGLFGVVEFLSPRTVVDASMRLATTDGSDVELRPWVYRVARVEGLVIALWALRGARRAAREPTARAPAASPTAGPTE